MRITLTSLSLFLLNTTPTLASETTLLRGSTAITVDPTAQTALTYAISTAGPSTCISKKLKSSCEGQIDADGNNCVWCDCQAVPSECLSVQQSQGLPAGVFNCGTVPLRVEADDGETEVLMDYNDADEFKRGYTLSTEEVDGSLCDPGSKSLSGYLDIKGSKYDKDGEDKHLFFWFFEKRASKVEQKVDADVDAADIPLILWLTGGPGCSSTLALLTENGPCSVHPDGKSTTINPHSWTEAAHVLWLDQPAGVGYSYGKTNDYNEAMVSEDAYYFLQAFYKEHPEYEKNPLFVTGESYAGHYVPAIAHHVWESNKGVVEGDGFVKINLAGLAIGNGLTNPEEQYKYYPEMAYNNSHGIKTVPKAVYETMKSSLPACIPLIAACNKGDHFYNHAACQSAFFACNSLLTTPYRMMQLNPYDIRKKCPITNPLCYDFSMVETWLNLESTKKALHVNEDAKWKSCNMAINFKFHTDWMHDFSPYITDLLNANIPTLIYAGDVDFICNYMGNRAWTHKLDWASGDKFRAAKDHPWGGVVNRGDGVEVEVESATGMARSVDGFTFLQVYDAGHMVPSDKPEVALKMITDFVTGVAF